ncbi:MAG: hypothetical protein Q3976_10310 [Corynebacterium sp.]|nr:hypothetical protein [Corynebacterium sp.]
MSARHRASNSNKGRNLGGALVTGAVAITSTTVVASPAYADEIVQAPLCLEADGSYSTCEINLTAWANWYAAPSNTRFTSDTTAHRAPYEPIGVTTGSPNASPLTVDDLKKTIAQIEKMNGTVVPTIIAFNSKYLNNADASTALGYSIPWLRGIFGTQQMVNDKLVADAAGSRSTFTHTNLDSRINVATAKAVEGINKTIDATIEVLKQKMTEDGADTAWIQKQIDQLSNSKATTTTVYDDTYNETLRGILEKAAEIIEDPTQGDTSGPSRTNLDDAIATVKQQIADSTTLTSEQKKAMTAKVEELGTVAEDADQETIDAATESVKAYGTNDVTALDTKMGHKPSVDKQSNNYKFADADKRNAVDSALTALDTTNDTNPNTVFSTVNSAINALNGDAYVANLVEELKNLDYLSESQKNQLESAAESQTSRDALDNWAATIRTLAADQKQFNDLVAEKDTVKADAKYRNADSQKKAAYDDAVAANVDMTQLTADPALADAIQAIKHAKNALDGVSDLQKAKNDAIASLADLNLNEGQKTAAREAINAADSTDAVSTALNKAQDLSAKRTEAQNAIDGLTKTTDPNYILADDAKKTDFDSKVQALKDALAKNDATADSVSNALSDAKTADSSLNGTANAAAAVSRLNDVEYLSSEQKNLLGSTAKQQDSKSALDAWEESIKDLAAKQKELRELQDSTAVNAVKSTVNYTNADVAKKVDYDQAVAADIEMTNLDNKAAVDTAISDIKNATNALNGDSKLSDAKTAAKAKLAGLDLSTAQREAAERAIDDASSDDAVNAAYQNASDLSDARKAAKTAAANLTGSDAAKYKFADSGLKTTFDGAKQEYATALDAADAIAATVNSALTKAQDADAALNGDTKLQEVLTDLADEDYLSSEQKAKLSAAANEQADQAALNSWASDVKALAAAQKELRELQDSTAVNAVKWTVNYTNADAEKKSAYDEASSRSVAMTDLGNKAAVDKAIEDITAAKNALNGDSKLSDAKAAAKANLAGLDLSPAQREAAERAIDAADSNDAVNTAYQNASNLSDARKDAKTAAANFTGSSDAKYKFADSGLKTAFDGAKQEYETALDAADATAATVNSALTKAQDADAALNGETKLQDVLSDLSDEDYLSSEQKAKLSAAANEQADQAALDNWASGIKTLAATQKSLRDLQDTAAVNTVRDSYQYRNDTTEKQQAYDNAVGTQVDMNDLVAASNLQSTIQAITDARDALSGVTDLEKAKSEAIASLDDLNLSPAQKEAAKTKIEGATDLGAVENAKTAATELSSARTNAQADDSFSSTDSNKYKVADDGLKSTFDQATSNYNTALDAADATAESVASALDTAKQADAALNGETKLAEVVDSLKKLVYLTEEQKDLLADAAASQSSQSALNTWADSIRTLATKQNELKTLVDDAPSVREGYKYRNGTEGTKNAYDEAVGTTVAMNSLTPAENLDETIEKITEAKAALDGETDLAIAKNEATNYINGLNLTQQQKDYANAAVAAAEDAEAVEAARNAAKDLADQRTAATNAQDGFDTSAAKYKFADDNLKQAFTEKQAALAAAMDKREATAEEVKAAITAAQEAYNALNGATNLAAVVASAQSATYLSETQKGKLEDAATALADKTALDSWAQDIATLAEAQKKFVDLVNDKSTVQQSYQYRNAEQSKREAYDQAVAATVTMDNLTADANLAQATTAIEDAKNALDGVTDLQKAKNEAIAALDDLNLTTGQKNAAIAAINSAQDESAVRTASTAAQNLSDKRNEAALPANALTDTTLAKYKFADDDKRDAFDQAAAALANALNADNATADSVSDALSAAQSADNKLNGDTVLADAITAMKAADYLSETQQNLVESTAPGKASRADLDQMRVDVTTLATSQKQLRDLQDEKATVMAGSEYRNADSDKQQAYTNAVETVVTMDSLSPAANLSSTISAIEDAKAALDGKTDKEVAKDKIEAMNLTEGQKAKAKAAIDEAEDSALDGIVDTARSLADARTTAAEQEFTSTTDQNYVFADPTKKSAFDNAVADFKAALDADNATADSVTNAKNAATTADAALDGVTQLDAQLDALKNSVYLSETQKNLIGKQKQSLDTLASLENLKTQVSNLAETQKSLVDLQGQKSDVLASAAYRNADEDKQQAYTSAVDTVVTMDSLSPADNLSSTISAIEAAKAALDGKSDKDVAKDKIDALNLSEAQKNKAKADIEAASDSDLDGIVDTARSLADARTEAQKAQFTDSSAQKYVFAAPAKQSAFDNAVTDFKSALDAADATVDSVNAALGTARAADDALDGVAQLASAIGALKSLDFLSEAQKTLLEEQKTQLATQDELNTLKSTVTNLAATQKSLVDLQGQKSDVLASAAYRNADEDKQQAYTSAVDTVVTMDSLSPADNLSSTISAIEAAKAALDGKSDKDVAKDKIDALNLSEAQKNKAKADIEAASDSDLDGIVDTARSLADARTTAQRPENALTDTGAVKYKFADADLKADFNEKAQALSQALDEADATADSVQAALSSATAADAALNGQSVVDNILDELRALDYLSPTQQGALEDAAIVQPNQQALNTWAQGIRDLAGAQKELRELQAEKSTVTATPEYRNADADKQQAYTNAVDTEVAMSSLNPADNLAETIAAIKAAKAALDGLSDEDVAKNAADEAIDAMNLTAGQKQKAKEQVSKAADIAAINEAVAAAQALSDARTEAQKAELDFTDTNSVKFKFADTPKQQAFTSAVAALSAVLDADDASAATVNAALDDTTAADTALNGQQNFNSVVNPLQQLGSLTPGQRGTVPNEALKTANLKELVAFAKHTEDVNTQQKILREHMSRVDSVRNSVAYMNASAEKREAYDQAITRAQAYIADSYSILDSTVVEELTSAAEDVNQNEDALNGVTVDYSKLQNAVDKEVADDVENIYPYQNATEEEKAAYRQALANAKELLNNKNATQEEVDAALAALTTARENLSGREVAAVSGSSDLHKLLLTAGVGAGLIGLMLVARDAVSPAPAAGESAPAATSSGSSNGAAANNAAANNPQVNAPVNAAADNTLAVTGASSTPLVASIISMAMGAMLLLGFRRRED